MVNYSKEQRKVKSKFRSSFGSLSILTGDKVLERRKLEKKAGLKPGAYRPTLGTEGAAEGAGEI
jgi:hypothetical protein